ncbi:unnamed protein product [marine sediment metagenome]|uniref:Uncharacterized protein n=1 Tax=marine sediment metagenome TaxID=412755 RepID=X1GL75_9ZZZZ
MKIKKYAKQGMGLMTTGVALGVGTGVASSLGATQGAAGMSKLSGALPVAGKVMGTGMVLDSVKHLQKSAEMPKKKKKGLFG